MISRLQHDEELQYDYVKKLIEVKKDDIRLAVTGYSCSKNSQEALDWQRVLLLHVTLANKREPKEFVAIIKVILKEKFYPMEECLKICEEFNQLEACALLAKRVGYYMQSVETYFKIIADQLDMRRFRKELFYMHKE